MTWLEAADDSRGCRSGRVELDAGLDAVMRVSSDDARMSCTIACAQWESRAELTHRRG